MKKITKNIDLLNSTTMKTLRLIGMTIMMVLVAGCFTACSNSSDDDGEDGNGNYKKMIIGRWLLTEIIDSEGNPISYKTYYDGEGVEFDSNGSFTLYGGGYKLGGSWAEIWEDKEDRVYGNYSIEGNRLYMSTKNNGSGSLTIISLTM